MKLALRKLILAALAAVTVNTLISCAPKGGEAGVGKAKGTQDSGGGNGVGDKAYESYIVDVTKLPAFTNYIFPIFKNMKSKDGADNAGVLVASLKTWIIAPVELDTIDKDLLGISFVKTGTQQLARQTKTEIWIDKSIFDRMSEQDQGELVLHEMIETMYFYKFISVRDFCGKAASNKDGAKATADCVRFSDAFDKAIPPEAAHPLNDLDNANIRAVTGWLKLHATQPFTEDEFNAFCLSHGFDKRFFGSKSNVDENLKDLKISRAELFGAIKGAQIAGQLPSVCTALTLNHSENCTVNFTEKDINFGTAKAPGMVVDVTSKSGSTQASFFQGDEVNLTPQTDGLGGFVYLYYALTFQLENKVGDRTTMMIFMFKKDPTISQTGYVLESISLKNGVIIGVDKTKDPVCTTTTLKPTVFFEDAIRIHKPGVEMNLAERLNMMVPPMAACR